MRDPMSWSIPLFRLFGIQVRVHIFFFIVTLGLFYRQMVLTQYDNVSWVDKFLLAVVVLFGIILLHEFGHCFGARYVGGDAREILIWPLGGLAFTEIPHRWKPLFITVAAGPGVNVLICLVCAGGILAAGFVPTLDPTIDPHRIEASKLHDSRTYTSSYRVKLYKAGTAEEPTLDEFRDKVKEYEARHGKDSLPKPANADAYTAAVASMGYERAVLPGWVVWAYRIFWLSWLLFLFNMLPAYPLDGGQLLQSIVWARTDHRRGVVVAAYTGFAVAIVFLIASIGWNESLLMGLALFMLYSASMKLMQLEMDEGPFGYDFSAGYTSLEKDDEPAPQPKRPGPLARWWQARKARKVAREVEAKQRDEERMDLLLEKIARSGQGSLTDEERQFLKRVSARKRNTS
ncbi:site-2 protease family protein [Gemmata sp. G18]|uniref:Site-2 protease family protein n=1 Tax=Gemmata palustris TaxID=2822762 RepID=A0ABS5BW90_9BACT|nr:site-2 protease family protein [Gemmata palustris]MBP3957515.1 site-2 protease family protein [Gemmata palustris]